MARMGVYDKGVIKTPHVFEQGQRVLIVPLDEKKKVNERKMRAMEKLKARNIPSFRGDLDVEKVREERLKKYEAVN